jgi:hypothetical protein
MVIQHCLPEMQPHISQNFCTRACVCVCARARMDVTLCLCAWKIVNIPFFLLISR